MSQELEKNHELSTLDKVDVSPVVLTEEVTEVTESIGEAVDLEGLGITMGKVSDRLSKLTENDQGGSSGKNSSKQGGAIPLKVRTPGPKVMKRDVENKIKEEIDLLSKKANKLINKAHKGGNQFELVIVMRKLRKLRQLLNSLIRFSGDQIRNLWFRFVKDRK